tara:strand:+ start:11988 stop:18821 length:6834 start_codon:yes stop_codon:yes gene_type:complete
MRPDGTGTGKPEDPGKAGSNIQEVSITDLISEGPIQGLVNGEASVYLEGDQLSSEDTILKNSEAANEAGEPHTITFAAASSNLQPVTASMKDRDGNTAYYNDLKETYTRDNAYRFITVFGLQASDCKIEGMKRSKHEAGGDYGLSEIKVCAVAGTPLAESTLFYTSHKSGVGKRSPTLRNLKPIIRVITPSGHLIKGSVIEVYGDDYNSVDTSGPSKRVTIQVWGAYSDVNLEKDIYTGSNQVYGKVYIDRVWLVDIRTVSGNNVIYIPKQSNSLSVTDKTFWLHPEDSDNSGTATTGSTPANSKKYPGSSVEFRVGNLHQEPLYQLSGPGVASFPLTLSASDSAPFNSTNNFLTSAPAAGYPTSSDITTAVNDGAIQKVLVFSQSFSGAQISEIDEIKIQLEFPNGHYATNDEGNDQYNGAAFSITLEGSESGGSNPTDWEDLTGGAAVYQRYWGLQKTAVVYTIILPINTHLNIRDLRLVITRLTPDGVAKGNNYLGKLSGNHIIRGATSDIAVVLDTCQIAQVVATIKEKLSYPYSAVAGVSFSSQSFPSAPSRAYHVRGLKIKIPSNYKPRHLTGDGVATYTGMWNGEFSDEGTTNSSGLESGVYYTDNPAWVFYDMLINDRYGLGDFLTAQDINKFQLYKIAKYCDELVPTKYGETEPRFTSNLYLTKPTEAYKVLKDMATMFRGLLYWLDGQMIPIQDSPAYPIYNFSPSNIIKDTFQTQNSGSKARTNQYTVIWNNPSAAYKPEPIVIEDKENILTTGQIIPKKAVAFGCTSEGQAIRYGRWKAWTSVNQTEVATFKTSVNASFLTPGDIINIQDPSQTGTVFSGRITASSNSAITLDVDITTVSSQAQSDGGRAQSFSFQSSSDYAYSLALLVLKRKVVLTQEAPAVITHSGATYTYNRGDEVVYAKIDGTSTQLIGNSDSDEDIRKTISNIQDNDGTDIQVEFRNSTDVESITFTSSNVSVVNGVTQIAIAAPFSGEIPDNTIWSIRETYKGVNTLASYKEYKILGLKEDSDKFFEITAVEFFNSKFDIIDKDFTLALQDTVIPPVPDYVPPPESVYILDTPDFRMEQNEITLEWEPPRNTDGSTYQFPRNYVIHIYPPLPDGTDYVETRSGNTRRHVFKGIPDGVYDFGVQTFSKFRKRSEITWRTIELVDKFAVSCSRMVGGIPRGIFANCESKISGSTFSLDTVDFAIRSNGAPGTVVNNANQGTAATYQQDLTAMAATGKEITRAHIYFDADDTTDYLKLVLYKRFNFENASLGIWYDRTQWVSNSENVWTDCTNSADARVKVGRYSNKVEKSEGTTAFLTRFQVGDVIRIKTATNTYYAGVVAFIENDNILFTQQRLNNTANEITSVDESKAIARNALRPDYANDAVIAFIGRDGSTYSHERYLWTIDPNLQGLRALIVDTNVAFLNYNSSSVLQNEVAITLTADALAYSDPEFIITGAGFSQTSESAQSTYVNDDTSGLSAPNDVTGQSLTWKLHDGTSGIGYDNGSALNFSVTVRESADESESKTKDFKIIKVQDGSIGLDGKTARLDLSDYSILYNDNGQGPRFTGTTSVGGTVGEVTLNTKKEGSETNGWIKITVNTTNFTDPVFRIYYGSSPTYLVDSITAYSGWMDGTAGASTVVHYPVPTGYSNNLTTGSSININVDVAEKPANFNGSNLPASGDIKATDSCSLMSLVAGEVGRTISVSNPTHVFQAENDGTVESETKTGSGTTLEFLKGGIAATYVGGTGSHSYNSGSSPDPNEWRIKSAVSTDTHLTVGTPTGVSNNIVTIGDHAVTGGIDDTETITYTIELGTKDGVKEYKAVQVFAKAKAGETPNNTGIVYMYKVASSTPTIGSDFPNVTVGLTGTNSGKITSATNNQIGSTGWFIVPQNPGTDDLYVVAATFNGTGSSDTIAYSEWTEATPISGTDGAAGTHGLSTGVSTLYKRTNSDSVPNGPSGSLTYTFSTAAVTEGSGQSGNLNGWSATAQSPDNSNKFQWRTTAAAIATATQSTDTIASNEWSAATISAQYVKGDEGDAGQRSIQGYIYFRVADGAANPFSGGTGTYTFSSGGLTALTQSSDGSTSITYSNAAYEIEVAGDYDYYAARYYGLEATGGPHSTIAVTVTAAVAHTSFTGVVTFNSGTNLLQLNGNDLTTIDGASITTGILRSAGTNTTSATGAAFTGNNAHAYFNLTNGAIATNNFRVQTNGDAEFKGSIQATGGTLAGGGWRIVGYNIMGGGYGSVTSTTGWPNANVTLDSNNARIIIRETTSETAGVNRVTLGNLS